MHDGNARGSGSNENKRRRTMTEPVEELTVAFDQLLHVANGGVSLAMQLVAGITEDKPQDLSPEERIRFIQHLTSLTDTEFRQMIDHMGGIEIFHEFLVEEAKRRRKIDINRIAWRAATRINPEVALNSDQPSVSRVAGSNKSYVQFPRNFPAVCPAILRCKSFLKFHDVLRAETENPSVRLEDFPGFLQKVNASYPVEEERCTALQPLFETWMQQIPGVRVWLGERKHFNKTKTKLDFAFHAPHQGSWPLAIIEVQNEAHSHTKSDPIAQSAHYYLQQLQASRLRGAFNAPALILQLVGTHVAAHAIIHSGHESNGPTPAFVGTHFLAAIDMGVHHGKSEQHQRTIHAFWVAVRECVHELMFEIASQLVIDLSRPAASEEPPEDWRPIHTFPCIVQAGSFHFRYVRPLGADKMAFEVALLPDGELRVVKFVNHTRYAKGAHELLALHGFAPQICHSEIFHDEWTMLIMQHMTNMRNVDDFEAPLTQAHREQETRALTILHSSGFVHGDLRNANVMVNESGRVCIIDFDWSGKQGEARYPLAMNTEEITWPVGAEPLVLIEKAHDLEWHRRRYAFLEQEDVATEANAEENKT